MSTPISHRILKQLCTGLVLLLPLVLSACSNQPSYKIDHDENTDFSQFKSYRWYDDLHASKEADYRQFNSSDERVRTYVDRELKRKGLRESSNQQSDLWVNYHISKQENMRVDSFSNYPSKGVHGGVGVGSYGSSVSVGYSTGPSVKTYKEGTVVLDVINTRTNKIIWRGIAEGKMKGSLSIKDKNHIASEVSKELLQDFPPQ